MKIVLVVFICIALCLVLFEVAWHGVIYPSLQLRHVVITTSLPIDKEMMLVHAGLHEDRLLYTIDTEEVETRLEALPMIADAEVRKSFPASLSIRLVTREAIGSILTTVGGRTVPAFFDAEGVIFSLGSNSSIIEVPVFSGIELDGSIRPGHRLPERIQNVLGQLAELKDTSPDLFSVISELEFFTHSDGSIEMLLYPSSYHIPIRLSSRINTAACTYAFFVLDTWSKNKGLADIAELDLRSGNIVLKSKEDEYVIQ